jgi:bifunctional UDP-N-acetylglucosamine pyrophosphorylase/glucosamine-1-phosphate N-acetyltransferase
MANESLAAVILAAGQGKRMKSDLPKVLHEVGGMSMVEHVVEVAREINADPVYAVVGHGRNLVIEVLDRLDAGHVVQERQLGTGHAVLCAEPELGQFQGDVLVLAGDVPLLSAATLRSAVELHRDSDAAVTIVTADAPDPTGYGRILRGDDGDIRAIREHKDASESERAVREINSGILLFKGPFLFESLSSVGNENAQGEYYLTDVVHLAFDRGLKVAGYKAPYDEIQGVNSRNDLERVESIWRERSESA